MIFLLETLAELEVFADVLLCSSEDYLAPDSFGKTIHLDYFPESFFQIEQSILKRLGQRILQTPLGPRRFDLAKLDALVFGLFKAQQYALLVGVDPQGIAVADYLNRWIKRPLAYVSFEILCAEDLGAPPVESLGRLERAACERTALVLIQDDERADLFCRERAFPRDKTILVPVAPPPQEVIKSDYLRKALGIPGDKRIVLYSGSVAPWASRDELAEMVAYWPADFCLVIHSRKKTPQKTGRYLKQLTETGRVYLSTQPVSRQEMTKLVGSADYGLAPYKPVPDDWTGGENIYHLGLASGKVAYYALCGLPILARALPVFEREFANYGCGKVYQRLAETGQLLAEMDNNYARYSAASRRFYLERLNPVAGMRSFCDRLMRLAGRRGDDDE